MSRSTWIILILGAIVLYQNRALVGRTCVKVASVVRWTCEGVASIVEWFKARRGRRAGS